MAHYRISRTLPNGWQMRLDMVSYNTGFENSPTELDEVVLLELGQLKCEFDSLPYGLVSPMSFDFKLIWDQLPSQMRTYLETGFVTVSQLNYRNTWFLYTDRGTNGATWTLEFAGVEDNIEALELERLPNGMFSYGVELVDIVYFHLKTIPSELWWNLFGTTSTDQRNVWQVLFQGNNQDLLRRRQRFEIAEIGCVGRMMLLSDLLDVARVYPLNAFTAVSHTNGGFDYTEKLKTVMTHAVDFFAPSTTTSLPRNGAANPLALSDLYVLAYVRRGSAGEDIGGVQSASDQFTIRKQGQSYYDTLRQFIEQSAVRVGYRFEHFGSGPSSQIRVYFDVGTITQSRDYAKNLATPDQTLDLDTALSISSVTVRGDNILKAETRFETTSDKDATQIVKIQQGARASRSFNFEPLLINVPVDVQDNNRDNEWPFFKAPIRQTNQIYIQPSSIAGANANDDYVKVHEKTKVTWGAGANEYVLVDPNGLKNPVSARDFKTNATTRATYYIQINDCQVNGGNIAAVTTTLLNVFSNERNAILEVDWSISNNTKVLADYICGRYSLTGQIATTFASLNWGRAIPVMMEIDFLADKVKHKYMLVK